MNFITQRKHNEGFNLSEMTINAYIKHQDREESRDLDENLIKWLEDVMEKIKEKYQNDNDSHGGEEN